MYLLTKDACYTASSSFFILEGCWEDGFKVKEEVLILLGLKEGMDYCEVGESEFVATPNQMAELALLLDIPLNIQTFARTGQPGLVYKGYTFYATYQGGVDYFEPNGIGPITFLSNRTRLQVWENIIPGFCPAESTRKPTT